MKVTPAPIPDVLFIEPAVFRDSRGLFFESWNARDFARSTGYEPRFVQDNHSRSQRGVLRGLHYQIRQSQGKLVRVVRGRVFDVVVDLRRSSPTFGQWCGSELSEDSYRLMWIPVGFAHGFLVLSESADFFYKCTDYYAQDYERCVIWNDPAIGVAWPLEGEPILSERDRAGVLLRDAEVFP